MNFFGKSDSQSPMENILFPDQKIKPYKRSEADFESTFNMQDSTTEIESKGSKKKRHSLEVTPTHLLLQKIFQPYLILVKVLGCQPISIKNGVASCRYWSWNMGYSVFFIAMFLFDTLFYLPIMKSMNPNQEKNFLVYLTEIILVLSQIFAAYMSYIFMIVKAKKVTKFWNRLHAVLVKLVSRCSRLDLVPSYKNARMKVILWAMFTVVFGACYMVSFQDDVRKHLSDQPPTYYYIMFFVFTCYSVLLSIHILHSTCFTTFICVLCTCFKTLGVIALKQDGQGTMVNSHSRVLFQETLEIYEELMELKRSVGDIYGIYIALEILAMMICTTINFFFMISNPGLSTLFCLNVAIVVPYLIWFHDICCSGGDLFYSMKKCYLKIRKAVANASQKVPMTEIAHIQVDPPDSLTAAGYFVIDWRLFTTVIGTIATYLVVTLQFGTGMNMNLKANASRNSTE